MTLSDQPLPILNEDSDDSMVCYCYRLTTRQLREAYAECGSLSELEKKTRAGTGCSGCKVILHALFNEKPSEAYQNAIDNTAVVGSACKKPGHRIMKGFVVANNPLQSIVYSSNAVAPQFGECDGSAKIEYLLLDQRGAPVIHRTQDLATNETFVFDTSKENLPNPFVGMFILVYDRSNLGASRFNIYWGNQDSALSATHENSTTGRPHVFLPIIVTKEFLSGPNTLYIGLMNPHQKTVPMMVSLLDIDTGQEIGWESELLPFNSMWINTNEQLFPQAFHHRPNGRFVIRMVSGNLDRDSAITFYHFMHNKITDLWTAQHL